MEDERLREKLEVIRAYLKRELEMAEVAFIEDHATMDYVFRVEDDRGIPRHWLRIGRDTLDDHRVVEIEPILEHQQVTERIQRGEDPVRVIHPQLRA